MGNEAVSFRQVMCIFLKLIRAFLPVAPSSTFPSYLTPMILHIPTPDTDFLQITFRSSKSALVERLIFRYPIHVHHLLPFVVFHTSRRQSTPFRLCKPSLPDLTLLS